MQTKNDLTVARTILSQISVMTKMACGAREFVGLEDGVQFRVGGRSHHKIVVKLNGLDLYDVELIRIKRVSFEVVSVEKAKDVYAEDLSETIYHMVNK